ncbi:hypothetical protein Pint_04179 [Pistacia integerrima]|uniref:Uncharacterized protein n=1 Tax=Pistacia integerrima TaxID=434235 RepID=A0ACC0Z6A6_9ROSI|nr:hypothetical protein Pint_04179 [Pistacia integerrima]
MNLRLWKLYQRHLVNLQADSKASDQDHDTVRMQDGERDGCKNAMEILELQFEERVGKLERTLAQLKAARFALKWTCFYPLTSE